MSPEFKSMITILIPLYFVAAIALIFTLWRRPFIFHREKIDKMLGVYLFGVTLWIFHFAEEWISGIYIRLPELFGLPPVPAWYFVLFNLVWLIIWLVAIKGVKENYHPAYFAPWFFTFGMILNLFAHPALAIMSGGYFPGLITSPFVGLLGLLLLKNLMGLPVKK